MQQLVTLHSLTRWLVLIGLLAGAVIGAKRYREANQWSPHLYQLIVMLVDVQVTIGAVIWLFSDGWRRGFFFSVLHPGVMVLALGLAHGAFAVAKKRDQVRSWLIMSVASLVSLVLIISAIPWDRL